MDGWSKKVIMKKKNGREKYKSLLILYIRTGGVFFVDLSDRWKMPIYIADVGINVMIPRFHSIFYIPSLSI